jgi:hypothetical protein
VRCLPGNSSQESGLSTCVPGQAGGVHKPSH